MIFKRKTVNVSCLDCEQAFEIEFRPIKWQIIACPYCNTELEVVNTQPLEFSFYFEDMDEDEDWDAGPLGI